MRIIGGQYRGKTIHPPKGLVLRPTTDFAKEALFNILNNKLDLENAAALDLFCGTGNISFELASRGATVKSVDKNFACIRFISEAAKSMNMPIAVTKSDVFKYLENENGTFDIIFADPPYDLENIEGIHARVMKRNLLKAGGWLIIEHGPKTDLSQCPHFREHRSYGHVNFSFFTITDLSREEP
ncbi:MAG: RsmD family RNA methyltransferase [Bacteroidia bacterium]